MSKEYFTSGEVAHLLGIPPRTARRYVTNGKIHATQNPITGTWTVSREALVTFMQEHNLDPSLLLKSYKVMVVDDEPDIVRLIIRLLEKTNQDLVVESSTRGYEALIKIGMMKPDLVCLDVQMPGIDGIELLQTLKHNDEFKDLKILIVTGHADYADRVKTLGADDTLIKPFSSEQFISKISMLLPVPEDTEDVA